MAQRRGWQRRAPAVQHQRPRGDRHPAGRDQPHETSDHGAL